MRLITVCDETLSITQWARRLGCSPQALYHRLRRGWEPAEAVTQPVAAACKFAQAVAAYQAWQQEAQCRHLPCPEGRDTQKEFSMDSAPERQQHVPGSQDLMPAIASQIGRQCPHGREGAAPRP